MLLLLFPYLFFTLFFFLFLLLLLLLLLPPPPPLSSSENILTSLSIHPSTPHPPRSHTDASSDKCVCDYKQTESGAERELSKYHYQILSACQQAPRRQNKVPPRASNERLVSVLQANDQIPPEDAYLHQSRFTAC